MMPRPGSLISRLLALAVLVIALLAAYQFLIMPVIERLDENEQQIAQKSKLLQQYRLLEAKEPALAERLEDIRSRDDVGSGYWQGGSAVLTAAKLQDRISESVEDHGGSMTSVQTLAANNDAEDTLEPQKTRLKARFATTLNSLAAILHDMESDEPYMFIDQLSITSNQSRRNIVDANNPKEEPKLDVNLNIFGYIQANTEENENEFQENDG